MPACPISCRACWRRLPAHAPRRSGSPTISGSARGLTPPACRGAAYRGAGKVGALAAEVRSALAAGSGATMVYGYHPDLDHAGHVSSIASTDWREAANEVDRLVTLLATDVPADTAILV